MGLMGPIMGPMSPMGHGPKGPMGPTGPRAQWAQWAQGPNGPNDEFWQALRCTVLVPIKQLWDGAIYIYNIIRRPLDREATRLRSILFMPASCILCILVSCIFVSLYVCMLVCCILYAACCMLVYCILNAASCILYGGVCPENWLVATKWAGAMDPGVLVASQPAAIYCMYVNMVHLQPLCSHMQPLYIHFLAFWTPRNPPGHQKTMKIIIVSSKLKVLLISKTNTLSRSLLAPFWTTLGTILIAFAFLGHPFGASWSPKALQE